MINKRCSIHKGPLSRLVSLRNILLILPLLLVAGCGDVEWFPEYVRDPSTPDSFSFATKNGIEPGGSVTSDSVTISGITGGSAPISIEGPEGSNSKYSIDGQTATDAKGNVSNGSTVTVTHTASNEIGATTTSVLTIGTERESFSSITRTVSLSWQPATDFGSGFRQAIALVTANDNISGGHVIDIRDSLNTSFPSFAVTTAFDDPTGAFKTDETTVFTLNNQRIYVRNRSDNEAMTILTIDGAEFSIDLSK